MDMTVYIEYALSRLNNLNGGNDKFEILCAELAKNSLGDKNFLPSTGTDAGGDGGIDGWSFGVSNTDGKKIKYAFSVQEEWKNKIKKEVKKANKERYKEIRFFSNQSIRSRFKENNYDEFKKLFSDITVTFYDKEDIVSFIKNDEALGEIIDLPQIKRAVSIDYLRRNNQLYNEQKEINSYISRKVRTKNGNEDLVNLSYGLNKIAILEAPAGYGKTSVLKQLHQNILNLEDINLLPPAFIELKNYTQGLLRDTVNDAMSCNGDFICVDALLLIDGFDELKDVDKPIFLKELNSFIGTNQKYVRKAIISVRENEYDISYFLDETKFQKIYLQSFSQDELLKNYSCEGKNLILNDKLYKEYCDNIYYAVNLLSYYSEKKSFAKNIVDLLNFIENKEITQKFRCPYEEEFAKRLESLALFMVLHQEFFVSSKLLSDFNIQSGINNFSFSHKSVLEYMAAKKIARQSIDEIKKILFSNSFIVSYLNNVFGYTLNVLAVASEETYSVFKELSKFVLESGKNTDRLLEIEDDKIPSEMISDIFKAVIQELCEEERITEYPKRLVDFALQESNEEKNLSYLIDRIKDAFDNNSRFQFYTHFLQDIVCQDLSVFSAAIQTKLIQLLLYFLNNGTEEKTDLINCYFYTVCNLPELKNIAKQDAKFIYEKMILYLPDEYQEGLTECLSRFIINSDINFSFENCLSFYDKVITKFSSITHTDENGNWKVAHIYLFPSFSKLFKTRFNDNFCLLLEFVKYIEKRKHIYLESSQTSLNSFMEMVYQSIKEGVKNGLFNEEKQLLVMLTEYSPDLFDSYKLWKQLIEVLSLKDGIDIAKLILKDIEKFGNCIGIILRSMSMFFSKKIQNAKNVEQLHNSICTTNNEYERFLFYVIAQSYINQRNVNSSVSKKIVSYLPAKDKDCILDSVNNESKNLVKTTKTKRPDKNKLTEKKKKQYVKEISNILDSYNLELPENWSLPEFQSVISKLKEYSFLKDDKPFVLKYAEKIKWLAFYEDSDTFYPIDIENISISYIEKFIDKKSLLNFLTDGLKKYTLGKNNLRAIVTYLADNYESLLPFKKDIVRQYLIDYIKVHIADSYNQDIVNASINCNVKATDFDTKIFSQSFVLGEINRDEPGYTRLAYNYACSFIYFRYTERSEQEKEFLQNAVLNAYNAAKDFELKKCLAEYYIAHSFCGGGIYKFYIDYICESSEHKVSLSDVEGFYVVTQDFSSLSVVEKLFKYGLSIDENKDFDLRKKIENMAMKSYELIAYSVDEQEKLDTVIKSFEKVTGLKGLYKKLVFDWQLNFAKRHYIPYNVETIKKLA